MVKVRFAPSPTGFLHIGSARTCIFNWAFAKKNQGQFILRIEDTDKQRSKQEYLEEILDSLKWLGIEWSQILYQSRRQSEYHNYAKKLLDENKAHVDNQAIVYKYDFTRVDFQDLIRGHIEFPELPKDTEVLIKSDGTPTYNFACVIDDGLSGITHVIRGEDHIPNTPKQILLYQALGFKVPQFAHLPMILAEEGGKLSKRKGATSIRDFREEGFTAEGIVNYLLLLGWSPNNNVEIFDLEEAVNIFDLKDVNKTAAAFSMDKILWVNQEHIRKKSDEDLLGLMEPFCLREGILLNAFPREYVLRVIAALKDRLKTLKSFMEFSRYYFVDDFPFDDDAREILKKDLKKEFDLLVERFGTVAEWKEQAIEETFRNLVQELNIKARDLIHPVRAAVSGKRAGPSLFLIIEVLGKERVLKRLEEAKKMMEGD